MGTTTLVSRDLAAGNLVRPFGDKSLSRELGYYIVHKVNPEKQESIETFSHSPTGQASAFEKHDSSTAEPRSSDKQRSKRG